MWPSLPSLLPDPSKSVVLGRVLGAFGVQGWVRIKPFTESFDGLIEQPVWTLRRSSDDGAARFTVIEQKVHGGSLLAKLQGIDDRTAAEGLRGADVTVPRDELPPAEDGEYYWNDLIGLAVRNSRGVELGRITGMIAAPAHDVLRVQAGAIEGSQLLQSSPSREQLIPFVEPIVLSVDVTGGSVVVDWEADY